jgi:hypothetical protein
LIRDTTSHVITPRTVSLRATAAEY